MKKNVCVNYAKYSKEHYEIIRKHNEDRMNFDYKIPSLLSKEDALDKNVNYTFNNFDELEKKRLEYLDSKNRQDYQKVHILEFVIALSHDQVIECLKNNQNIDDSFLKYKDMIEKQFKVDAIHLNIHKDEGFIKDDKTIQYNYHAHLVTTNFDFENGKVVSSNFKRKDLHAMQDLANDSFQNLGFKRGESVYKTNAKHLSKDDYVKAKKQKELFTIFHELSSTKKELKATYTSLNKQKNEAKLERNKFVKDSELYKEFNNKFLELQALEKAKREEYRLLTQQVETQKLDIDFFKKKEEEAREEIKKILLEHTKKVKPLIGDEYIKVEDRNEMYNELIKVANKNFKFQNLENEYLKKQVETLQTQLTQVKNHNLQEHELLQKAIKAFEIKQVENKKQALKIKKLEERNELVLKILKNKNVKFSDFKNEYNNQTLKDQTISLLKNL